MEGEDRNPLVRYKRKTVKPGFIYIISFIRHQRVVFIRSIFKEFHHLIIQ